MKLNSKLSPKSFSSHLLLVAVYDVNDELWSSNSGQGHGEDVDPTLKIITKYNKIAIHDDHGDCIWYITPLSCTYKLRSTRRLYRDQYICSSNDRYHFGLNNEYLPVLIDTTMNDVVLWTANLVTGTLRRYLTSGMVGPGTYLEMKEDGNLSLINHEGEVLWSIECFSDEAFIVIRADGRLQLRSKYNWTIKVLISSDMFPSATPTIAATVEPSISAAPTFIRCYTEITTDGILYPSEFVCSPDGTIRFGLDFRGDLALFANNEKVWSSGTDEHCDVTFTYASLLPNGSLEVRDLQTELFSSNSAVSGHDHGDADLDLRMYVTDVGKVYIEIVETDEVLWTLVSYCLSSLFPTERLYRDQYICSVDGRWKFGIDEDYKLTMYDAVVDLLVWKASDVDCCSGPGTYLEMNENGNLELINQDGDLLWETKTDDEDHSYLAALLILNSAHVVINSHHGDLLETVVEPEDLYQVEDDDYAYDPGCTDLPGWKDSHGDGCDWYEGYVHGSDDLKCDLYGNNFPNDDDITAQHAVSPCET